MVTAYIALGANLGTPLKTLRAASHALATLPHTRLGAGSRIYRSAPVDATGPDFYNAVLSLHTQLDAHELLAHMQSLENIHGRVRSYPNAPRTLDLDLLLYGNHTIHTPTLTVPHPRMHLRAFVLMPLADIAPEMQLEQGAIGCLIAQCSDQAITPINELLINP
ncbi:MAG TPA: 2-amino-4-hydroxy-6-hydroxymethyldihydropteridine diphosphokinase [Paenalcaligenes sp.]|nr:2-amino-4-hydroxy-6-hydroxymethyldihydropteridine diphosphokinase [Paenalcaligenes sp.]